MTDSSPKNPDTASQQGEDFKKVVPPVDSAKVNGPFQNAGTQPDTPVNSGESADNPPSISSEELDKLAREATLTGFIALDALARIMPQEEDYTAEIYQDIVRVLWPHYQLHLRSPKEIPITTFGNRLAIWHALLYRWGGFGHKGVREGLNPISYLTLYEFNEQAGSFRKAMNRYTGGLKYIKLDDFEEYLENIQRELKIRLPLPKRLFCKDVEGENIEVLKEDNDPKSNPIEARNSEKAQEPIANLFRKKGEYFEISFCGCKPFLLEESIGLICIHFLLGRPGDPISAMEMARMKNLDPEIIHTRSQNKVDLKGISNDQIKEKQGMGKKNLIASHDKTIDWRAIESYKRRLLEIDDDLMNTNNPAEQLELKKERESIIKQLKESKNRFANESKKSRQSVGKNIRTAMQRTREHNLELFEYLKQTIKIGKECLYNPLPQKPISWTF